MGYIQQSQEISLKRYVKPSTPMVSHTLRITSCTRLMGTAMAISWMMPTTHPSSPCHSLGSWIKWTSCTRTLGEGSSATTTHFTSMVRRVVALGVLMSASTTYGLCRSSRRVWLPVIVWRLLSACRHCVRVQGERISYMRASRRIILMISLGNGLRGLMVYSDSLSIRSIRRCRSY